MQTAQHEVLSTREARAQLPSMLRVFRELGKAAQAFVIGSHRRPEAVVISYAYYLDLLDKSADAEMRAVAEERLSNGAAATEVDLDEVADQLGVARPGSTRVAAR